MWSERQCIRGGQATELEKPTTYKPALTGSLHLQLKRSHCEANEEACDNRTLLIKVDLHKQDTLRLRENIRRDREAITQSRQEAERLPEEQKKRLLEVQHQAEGLGQENEIFYEGEWRRKRALRP